MSVASDTPSVHPGLQRRPRADTFTIDDLLDDLRSGRIRVPHFQRGLKWQRVDARKLVDSVYRGYPIGSLLLWKKPAHAAHLRFGSVAIDAPARADALWVVDGQQRVTSLARLLLPTEPERDEFALYFDLDDEEFVPPSKRTADDSRFVPLTVVHDSVELMGWVRRVSPSEDRQRRAFAVSKRLREYTIPYYVVETDNEQVLREIFGRMNSTGKSLKPAEVFNALHANRSETQPASLTQVAEALAEHRFGVLEDRTLYKALLAIRGQPPAGKAVPELTVAEASDAFRDTHEAMSSVIAFMKHDVGIPHVRLLPYEAPLVVLAKLFHRHPEPAPRSRQLLARWVWRGAWTGRHTGATAAMRRTLDQIGDDEHESVQALLADLGDQRHPLPALESFSFGHASGKFQLLSLAALGPRHLATGARLDLSEHLELGAKAAQPIHRKHASTLANRVLHPPVSGGIRALLTKRFDAMVWGSHGIDAVAFRALRDGRYTDFFAHRTSVLEPHYLQFLQTRARWDDSDRPPIAALIVDDEP